MWRQARLILIAGCVLLGGVSAQGAAREESLHGINVDDETIWIQVTSNGCTADEDFSFLLKRKKRGVVQVTVIRLQPDTCEAAPQNITLQFPREDVGLKNVSDFVVSNAFRAFSIFGL